MIVRLLPPTSANGSTSSPVASAPTRTPPPTRPPRGVAVLLAMDNEQLQDVARGICFINHDLATVDEGPDGTDPGPSPSEGRCRPTRPSRGTGGDPLVQLLQFTRPTPDIPG